MPIKSYLSKINLTHPKQLQTLVENRRVFNMKNCELNVFETYQNAYHVPLTFNDLVITSMVRGKKMMHLYDEPTFEYLPGETLIVPANKSMVIDFPEADMQNPTQCIALAVDASYVKQTMNFMNSYYNTEADDHEWTLQFSQYHFSNDNEISSIINKLIRVCSSGELAKDIFADLAMKELLIRLVQSQYLKRISTEKNSNNNQGKAQFILHYIQEHLTEKISVDALSKQVYLSRNVFFKWFKEQFGITPLDYINSERMKLAKQLLADSGNSVGSVSAQCGFSDVNYFIRLFRKLEGITPKAYKDCIMYTRR